jgi:hypothetical protein
LSTSMVEIEQLPCTLNSLNGIGSRDMTLLKIIYSERT